MRKLIAFETISVDGYFVDRHNDMQWAKQPPDDEFMEFTRANVQGSGTLVFGRVTYEMMAAFWPTPQAQAALPEVADRMNHSPKLVFSRTLKSVDWAHSTLIHHDPVAALRKMKAETGAGMAILGSGNLVAQLAPHGLIDEYQLVVDPIALGEGRSIFHGLPQHLNLQLLRSRVFQNGKVFLCYGTAE